MQLVKKCLMVLPLLWCVAAFAANDDDGFGFDDLDAVEATEQQELLQMAKEAARDYEFSKAQSLIKQAEHKAYAPDAVKHAKQVLASAEKKKKREDEEKARLAEEKRQRELAAARARQQTHQYSGSSGGDVRVVTVEGDAISGLLRSVLVKDISMSGGPGLINDSSSSSSSLNITKGYNGIAGRYNYSLQLYNGVNKTCTGSVYIDGRHRWVKISVYVDSCRAEVHQY